MFWFSRGRPNERKCETYREIDGQTEIEGRNEKLREIDGQTERERR